jgi:hypothetical protein
MKTHVDQPVQKDTIPTMLTIPVPDVMKPVLVAPMLMNVLVVHLELSYIKELVLNLAHLDISQKAVNITPKILKEVTVDNVMKLV